MVGCGTPTRRRWWVGERRPVADGGCGRRPVAVVGERLTGPGVAICDGSAVLASPSATAHRPGVAICDGSAVLASPSATARRTRARGRGRSAVRGTTRTRSSDEPATRLGLRPLLGPRPPRCPLVTLDVHQLDQILLVGTGVLLLAILAVRLSVGVGLPSLLVYLLMGVLLGEGGPVGLEFENAELAHALGFACAGGDPGRRWSHDALAEDPAGDAHGPLPGHHRRRGERGDRGRRRALPVRDEVGGRGPAGRGHLADRRGGGVLRAPPGAAAEPADRLAGGGVGPQRRPDRGAGDRDQHGRSPRVPRVPGHRRR